MQVELCAPAAALEPCAGQGAALAGFELIRLKTESPIDEKKRFLESFKNNLRVIIIRIKKNLRGFLNLQPPLTWKVNPVLLSSKTSYFLFTGWVI